MLSLTKDFNVGQHKYNTQHTSAAIFDSV